MGGSREKTQFMLTIKTKWINGLRKACRCKKTLWPKQQITKCDQASTSDASNEEWGMNLPTTTRSRLWVCLLSLQGVFSHIVHDDDVFAVTAPTRWLSFSLFRSPNSKDIDIEVLSQLLHLEEIIWLSCKVTTTTVNELSHAIKLRSDSPHRCHNGYVLP
jgi:hypothetical protein